MPEIHFSAVPVGIEIVVGKWNGQEMLEEKSGEEKLKI